MTHSEAYLWIFTHLSKQSQKRRKHTHTVRNRTAKERAGLFPYWIKTFKFWRLKSDTF